MSKEKHSLENTLICLKDFKQKLENYNAPPNDEGWSLSNLPGHFWEGLGECINDIEYYLSSQTSTADCKPKYTNMKNYLLTDFNTERWKGINMESVKSEVEKLNEKIKIGCLFGEIGNPTNFFVISLSRASHWIKNLTFEDGKVYGDVEFLDNENGKKADNFINNMNYRFEIRSTGMSEQYKDGEIVIHSIFTWDIITE